MCWKECWSLPWIDLVCPPGCWSNGGFRARELRRLEFAESTEPDMVPPSVRLSRRLKSPSTARSLLIVCLLSVAMLALSAERTPWRELAWVSGSARSAERSSLEVPGPSPPLLLWPSDLPSRDFAVPRWRPKMEMICYPYSLFLFVNCKHILGRTNDKRWITI